MKLTEKTEELGTWKQRDFQEKLNTKKEQVFITFWRLTIFHM